MRVHIVYTSGGHIIDRIAAALVGGQDTHAWTLGDCPDPRADLNYFMPYLERERHLNFDETPTAAYFSHYETSEAYKGELKRASWDAVKTRVDLRVVTARMYGEQLAEFGPVAHTRPPVDPQFAMRTSYPSGGPTIGVSGYIPYKTGRKGERLVAKLAKELNVKASGRGWPVDNCQLYDWEKLPDFYRSLDVFLCASDVEGVPMTVLEAMACGVPCVVPVNVGMLDELPDMQGLYRYKRGNYNSMLDAVRCAIEQGGSPGSLTQAVAQYNKTNWQADHVRAFESLLYDVPQPEPRPKWNKRNAGLYMVAFRPPARECAVRAVAAWREHTDLPVALVSNEPLGVEDIFVEQPDADIGGRRAKLLVETLAPAGWDYVLYMDADTEVVGNIDFIFDALWDGWDFVICKNPAKYHSTHNMVRPDNRPECDETFKLMGTDEAVQLNGGVWAFYRNDKMRSLMRDWFREWDRWGMRDQAALLRALYTNPVRVYVLEQTFNCVDRYYERRDGTAIMHYPMTARCNTGCTFDRLDSDKAWGIVMNETGYRQGDT
jgi:hypothetical protein